MLSVASIPIDFWHTAAALDADLIYAADTWDATRGSHWTPGERRAYVYILSCGAFPCYIGKSYDPHKRFQMHRHRDWWPEAEQLTVFQVIGDSRDDAGRKALALEAAAIRLMRPLYNIAGVAQ